MPTKKQKQAVIRQLLIPIFLIIAALLYQPVKGLFVSKEKPVETKADGGSLTVSYIDVGQGDATLIQKGNFSMLIDAGKNEKGQTVVSYLKKKGIKKLKSADAFESWILKILTNKCKQKLNYKYNKFNVFNPNIKDESHMEKVESNSNIGNAEKTDVKIALSKLNTEDRMIVSLCVVEGYKSNEVAEILSMNPSTVRSRLNRSLKKMKEYLEVE